MTKTQRIRFEIEKAYRQHVAGTTERHDDLQEIRNKYILSTGGQYAKAIFCHGDSNRNY